MDIWTSCWLNIFTLYTEYCICIVYMISVAKSVNLKHIVYVHKRIYEITSYTVVYAWECWYMRNQYCTSCAQPPVVYIMNQPLHPNLGYCNRTRRLAYVCINIYQHRQRLILFSSWLALRFKSRMISWQLSRIKSGNVCTLLVWSTALR